MIALAVDDEILALKSLCKAIESSDDISEVNRFSTCSATLGWAKENSFDIAFLDINMRGIGGINLAKELRNINPECHIIFCTGYQEFAVDAFRLHADGYILKPIDRERLQEEIAYILNKKTSEYLLRCRCFGGFDVYDPKGDKIAFKRKRAKEVLAILIDKKGMGISAKEICGILWENDTENEKKNMRYLWNLLSSLTKTLKNVGAEEVLIHSGSTYSIDPTKIKCDYYDYLKGENKNVDVSEYMTIYEWSEATTANLLYKQEVK